MVNVLFHWLVLWAATFGNGRQASQKEGTAEELNRTILRKQHRMHGSACGLSTVSKYVCMYVRMYAFVILSSLYIHLAPFFCNKVE